MKTQRNVQSKSGVYMIINTNNGEMYVGATNNIKRRMYEQSSTSSTKCSPKLHIAINKYGIDQFIFFVLEYCDHFRIREMYYINLLNPEYNTAKNQFGKQVGFNHSTKSKKLMSSSKLGIKRRDYKSREVIASKGNETKTFKSAKEAAKTLNCPYTSVRKCLAQIYKTSGGYTFKYSI
tara:strand:- start:2830 stop:3363 length:534 start_codon:yes stop_codon:yes gene_type:complete